MSDFSTQFKSFADSLGQAASSVMNKLDQWSFRILVDNLKGNDYDAVKESIDQLVKEKKPIGIPPLYFVAKLHPNPYVRDAAAKGLTQFGHDRDIDECTQGKAVADATKALIDKFGNYRG